MITRYSLRYATLMALICVAIPAFAQNHWRADRPININLFDLREVRCADSLHAVAVGSGFMDGIAVHTVDGGRSWSTLLHDSTRFPGAAGETFVRNLRFYDVAYPALDLIIIVADSVIDRRVGSTTREEERGVILRSVDGGTSWTSTALDSGVAAYGVSMADAQHGLVRAVGGMLRTTDGGASWSHLPYPVGAKYGASDMQAITPDTWILFGRSGIRRTIYRTTDAGATWVNSDVTPPVSRIRFVDTLYGWAVGSDSKGDFDPVQDVIAHTTDGGITWTTQLYKVVGAGGGLQNLAFLDRQRGRAVGQFAKLLRTTNGGETWEEEESGISPQAAIHFLAVAWPAEETAMIATRDGYLQHYRHDAVLASPTIVSPADRLIDQPLSALIEWMPVPGATSYHLQVSEDAGFTVLIHTDDSSIAGTSREIRELKPNTTYSIRLRAMSGTDTSNWSSLLGQRSFTTGTGVSSVAIQQSAAAAQMQLWPNPVHESSVRIRMRYVNGMEEQAKLIVHDLLGEVILERNVSVRRVGEMAEAELEIGSLPSGSYQLVIDDGVQRGVSQLVIER